MRNSGFSLQVTMLSQNVFIFSWIQLVIGIGVAHQYLLFGDTWLELLGRNSLSSQTAGQFSFNPKEKDQLESLLQRCFDHVADMKQRRGTLTIPSSQEQAREDGFKKNARLVPINEATREDFEAAVSEGRQH